MTAWSKRRFLRGTGAALLATGTAGCLGSGKTGIGDSKNFEDVSYNADTKKLTVTIFTSPAIAPNHDDVVLVAFDRADDLKPVVYLDGEVDDTEFTFNFNGVITGTQTYRVNYPALSNR